jgi:hypothetical protein
VIKIFWRDKEIGNITDLETDIWYCNCIWNSNESNEAAEFRRVVANFVTDEIMKDPAQGTRITVKDSSSGNITNALVISLEDDSLFIRHVYDAVAVKWLVENVY